MEDCIVITERLEGIINVMPTPDFELAQKHCPSGYRLVGCGEICKSSDQIGYMKTEQNIEAGTAVERSFIWLKEPLDNIEYDFIGKPFNPNVQNVRARKL